MFRQFYRFFFSFVVFCCFFATQSLAQPFKTDTIRSGSGKWYPPAGCDSFYVELWGGGAGGNTSGSAIGPLTTGGGGGGSYVKSTTFRVNSSTAASGYDYVVGGGGSPSGNGSDSWFFNTLCIARGGRTRGTTQQAISLNQYVAVSNIGGGGGWSHRNLFNQYWHGGGGAAGRRFGSGYVGGNAVEGTHGGGAEGFVYDNVDVSKGRGGQTNAFFAGVPGGGGAGDQEGQPGIILITYRCSFTPGSIGYSHTVPDSREFGPRQDTIFSIANASPFSKYVWEATKDIANGGVWSIRSALDSGATAYVEDTITGVTYYRRRVTNACAVNTSAAPVMIKVFTNTTGKNGVIVGRVTSNDLQTGVPGITITAKKNSSLLGSPSSKQYFATTDANGDYTIRNIFYGDETNGDLDTVGFTVTASRPGRRLSPPVVVIMAVNTPRLTANFVDSTVYTVKGRVWQKCNGCIFPDSFGVGNVRVTYPSTANVERITDSLSADSIGMYAFAIPNPSTLTFTPAYGNRAFSPASSRVVVDTSINNVNFYDTTSRAVTGKLTDVALRRIGAATLLFEGVQQLRGGATVATFKKRARMNLNDSTYSVRLPAGRYRVTVDSFTAAFAATDHRYVSDTAVKAFFNVLSKEPIIDVRFADAERNLVYHRPPALVLYGLTDTACNPDPRLNPGLVFRTNMPKPFRAYVYEGPSTIGDLMSIDTTVAPSDTLSKYLRFYTDVTKRGDTERPDTILFRLKNRERGTLPMLDTSFIPGVPNSAGDFTKTFRVFYYDRYGREARLETPLPARTTVVGVYSPTNTYITASPEVPFLILHAPPGDQSYSFWNRDAQIQTSTSFRVATQNEGGAFANVSLGQGLSVSSGAVSFDVNVIAQANYSYRRQVVTDGVDEFVTTISTNQRFQTDRSNRFIRGVSGDVYIGNATNYLLGRSKTVDFIPLREFGNCAIETSSRLYIGQDSVQTEFAYTEGHIKNVIMPQLQELIDTSPEDTTKFRAESQMKVWQQVIDRNNENKKTASFIRNRSFSNGVGVDYSETITKSASSVLNYEVVVSNDLATELGLYIAGRGASGGVTISLQQITGEASATSSESAVTTGYHLQDGDDGDYFSVNIKKDSVYGTPVFDLFAGTSSCPPEEGAQNRDKPQILTPDLRFNNLDVNTPKFFTIELTNKSESAEPRTYLLSSDPATGEGLIVSTSGTSNLATNNGGVQFVNMAYDGIQTVQIKVEKFNPNDGVLSYPNVELYLSDVCSGGPIIPNSYATLKFSLNYASPCGGISLTAPTDGYVVNKANGNILPIRMGNYAASNIDSVTLQYQIRRQRSGSAWINGFTVRRNAFADSTTNYTIPWNIGALADSSFNLRLRLVCTNGDIIYSDIVGGTFDRVAPTLIGLPRPVAGIYIPGSDEISFTYSEPIKVNNLNSGAVEMVRRSNNSIVPVTATIAGSKIIITPSVDLGQQADSFRVIVRGVADINGNPKLSGDTSYFKLGTAPPAAYTGTNLATVSLLRSSVAEGSPDSIGVRFSLRERARKVTKVYFNVSGTAEFDADYYVTYDTIKVRGCADSNCINTRIIPVLNNFIGYPGYVNIDSGKTETILYIHTNNDAIQESNESIIISLVNGSDYRLQDSTEIADSVQVTALILNPAAVCPSGNILYVNSRATGNNSGVSWQNAMSSLQDALNRSCTGITQIWVAAGTYRPTLNTSRDSSFKLRNNLAIFGGFAGVETQLSQRDWRANPTVLSGDIGVLNNLADNSYHVVENFNGAVNTSALLDGFIIRDGNANRGDYNGNRGGGLFCYGSPSVYNCTFTGNTAIEYGGAVFNQTNAAVFLNNAFFGNNAVYGGAMYNEVAVPKLINCTFSGNVAGADGGAISSYAGGAQITNCILWGNSNQIRDAGGSAHAVTYSIIQGGYAGVGNLNSDPLFFQQPAQVFNTGGDLRLLSCSPAINAGNNAALPSGTSFDLGRSPRIVNTTVDIGAYERQALAGGVILYVDSSATGTGTGESWANAYTSLASAINELNACTPGTTINIARGTYVVPPPGTFNLNKLDATIQGGYPSGGGVPNAAANRTVIKGNVNVLKSVKMNGVDVRR